MYNNAVQLIFQWTTCFSLQKEVFVADCKEECLSDCPMALNLLTKGESELMLCVFTCLE